MTFILISGKEDVGKTTVCNRLHSMIKENETFICHDDLNKGRIAYAAHYEKNGKHIVMNSASDDDDRMKDFANYLDSLAQKPDIIITTIREDDSSGDMMSRMLALLEAIGNGESKLVEHYEDKVANKTAELASLAKTIRHNAFVLHLEEQKIEGVGKKYHLVKPYCDDNADKVKYMIDFALARL